MAGTPQLKHCLQAYVDGELSDAERQGVEQACAQSPQLAQALREHESLSSDMLELMKEHSLGRSLRQSVMDNLPEMDRRLLDLERAKLNQERRQRFTHLLPTIAAALIVVLGLTLHFNWPSAVPTGDTIGVIVQMAGSPAVYAAEDSLRRPATLSGYIQPGEIFETGQSQSLMMRLVGNSTVRLSADTRLRIASGRDVRMEKGTAFFDVGPAGRLFRVSTPEADITVFGTAFEVAVYDGHIEVTVARGEVSIENAHGWRVVRSGQTAAVRMGESPALPEHDDQVAQRVAWAEKIRADIDADNRYYEHLAQVIPPSIIGGVVVHMVDTTTRFGGRKPELESIRLRWNRGALIGEVCGYDVYVNDAQNNAIFKHSINDAVFEHSDASEYNIPIPDTVERLPRIFNVRLVPRCETGAEHQIAFQVSAVPSV
mgnify:CR=1 FL=1